MLQIFTSLRQINFSQLMGVYIESNLRAGKERYPDLNENRQIMEAEQDFYSFLTEFFREPKAFYAVWATEGRYQAALRIEPYADGVLLEGLETAPDSRRQGYAVHLVLDALQYLTDKGVHKVYSHVRKDNVASIRIHQACGFKRILECACYIDGSVDHKTCTFLKQL